MQPWKKPLKNFFNHRAIQVKNVKPTLEELCFISGRDPRVCAKEAHGVDLAESILENLDSNSAHSILEVGAGSGYIANFLSPRVGKYTGIDISKQSLEVAKRLKLPNAKFQVTDGANLPFPNNSFDAVVCQDVFTNFPDLEIGKEIIQEMLRVVRPGRKVLIGCVLDAEYEEECKRAAYEKTLELDRKFGKIEQPEYKLSILDRIVSSFFKKYKPEGQVICYFLDKQSFIDLGKQLGVKTEITQVHNLHPFRKFRFNVVYTKPA